MTSTSSLVFRLLNHLSDGQFHSGSALGEQLSVSRSAIWKAVEACRELGLVVDAVNGKGYRLQNGLDLLDKRAIEGQLTAEIMAQIDNIEIFPTIDSTNSYLLQMIKQEPQALRICLAEQQTQGRGRRGRTWVSPFGYNLYLSIARLFETDPSALAGLSLAIGVAVIQALVAIDSGVSFQLKWPNDILCQGKKLAGILVEMNGDMNGPCQVVVGIGINVKLSEEAQRLITQPCTSLSTLGVSASRNVLAALLIDRVLKAFTIYQQFGLQPFQQEWATYDAYVGQVVKLQIGKEWREGLYVGIDERGGLLLEREGKIERYSSGEVSLKTK